VHHLVVRAVVRCFELARRGGRSVRPNPQVGCVIMHGERIIGEGYHEMFSQGHAEVNAFASVSEEDRALIPNSTAYVSLEPCHHHGKTPPCVDLLIRHQIKDVKIALVDPNEKVNQKSITKLKSSGATVEVSTSRVAADLIAEFDAVHVKKRPFIQLKFAKSKYNKMGVDGAQIALSNKYTNIYTHGLRAYTEAILVGTNTALIDDPALTVRHVDGPQPLRIVLDRSGRLTTNLQLLSDGHPTLILTELLEYPVETDKEVMQMDFDQDLFVQRLCDILIQKGIHHLMVEGGQSVLKSFLKSNLWDEAVVISTQHNLAEGKTAPNINGRKVMSYVFGEDTVEHIRQVG